MNHRLVLRVAVVSLPLVGGCPAIWNDGEGTLTDWELRQRLAKQGVSAISRPELPEAKVILGQALMFDKILSGNRNISCATCHHPSNGTGDGLSLSKGQGGVGASVSRVGPFNANHEPILIPRNAPDAFNRGGMHVMFWDGRVTQNEDGSFTTPAGDNLLPGLDNALAAQAMFPVTSRDEMRGFAGENDLGDIEDDEVRAIWSGLMERLLAIAEYRDLFAAAYPTVAIDELTFAHAANAIAAFENQHWTLDDAPFDQYLRGDDGALSPAAKRGALLFYGEADCARCHSGSLMTDQQFHNICVPQLGPGKGNGPDGAHDFGRENVTQDSNDRFKFRTPPLRNVAVTGPWMHDGAYTSLAAAVRHMLDPVGATESYDPEQLREEFRSVLRSDQSEEMIGAVSETDAQRVQLTEEEVADLVAFLQALTSPTVAELPTRDVPASVPSGLPLAD